MLRTDSFSFEDKENVDDAVTMFAIGKVTTDR